MKRIYRHESFRYPTHSELDYDIALVKAATDINPSNFIRYACLPRKQTGLSPGHYCWVTGWGVTRGEGSKGGGTKTFGSITMPGRRIGDKNSLCFRWEGERVSGRST